MSENAEVAGWTVFGVACVVLVYFVVNFLYQGNRNNALKAERIRIAKIEACRTITDEALRTTCIVFGGLKEPG